MNIGDTIGRLTAISEVERLPLRTMALKLGFKRGVVEGRVAKGMDIETALTTPSGQIGFT